MLIVEKRPNSIASESYKTLRTNLQYSSVDEKNKFIVITSSQPGEGKSTVAGNLSISLAADGKKVILIDGDLRKPTIHKKFTVSNVIGLSDVIIGKAKLSDTCRKYNENLYILTAGKIPPNPSEMLASKAMSEVIDNLRQIYDYIIIDTPPVQAVTDAQVLSVKADGTILVVRAEYTKREAVYNTIGLLQTVNAKIIGIVLNRVDAKRGGYYYNYKRYGYGENGYYSEDNKEKVVK